MANIHSQKKRILRAERERLATLIELTAAVMDLFETVQPFEERFATASLAGDFEEGVL